MKRSVEREGGREIPLKHLKQKIHNDKGERNAGRKLILHQLMLCLCDNQLY